MKDITQKKGTKPSKEELPVKEEKPATPPSGGWGDSEHCTESHRNLEPHSAPPVYDPEWGHYRREGD